MYIRDYSKKRYSRTSIDDGYNPRSIGWLGSFLFPWKKGEVSPNILGALEYFSKAHERSDIDLGVHTCELCKNFHARAEFYIDLNGIRYILPQMVLHYIKEHQYKPPKKFLTELDEFWAREGEGIVEKNPTMKRLVPKDKYYV